ncbi:MAG TPA: amino acid aminotransferase [Woeseiaceae bacterium]|nr:amino acid aminotransferase [Woeseiaceae bacterium]
MFENLQPLPPDAILRLIAEYNDDPRRDKIDLGIGIYRDAEGATPVLAAVKTAEQRLVASQASKSYVGSGGAPAFNAAMQSLVFGSAGEDNARITTLQTPGGSGSLRVAAGLILRARPDARVWTSDPTWANHVPLLGGAGIRLEQYPYYRSGEASVRFEAMLETLNRVPHGDLVLLHACCHNPTGMDLSVEQWRETAAIIAERGLVPFIDIAYQGFAAGLDEDAFAIRHLFERVPEMIVSASCSKNFGLYRDRVGSLSIVSADAAGAATVKSQAFNVVRTLYSMPPDHGGAVVALILGDADLRDAWLAELTAMRERLGGMRTLLRDALRDAAPGHDFSHLVSAKGMFSFLGLSREQVERLKSEYGIYVVDSSRINVAGITRNNAGYLADSIAAVL